MASVTVPFATLAAGSIEVSYTYDDGSLAVLSVSAANSSGDAAMVTLGPFTVTIPPGTRTVTIPRGKRPTLGRDPATGRLGLPGWAGVGG